MSKQIEEAFDRQVAEEVAQATLMRAREKAKRAAEEARMNVKERSGTESFVKLLRRCPTPQRQQGRGRQSEDSKPGEVQEKAGGKCKAITRMEYKAKHKECKEAGKK